MESQNIKVDKQQVQQGSKRWIVFDTTHVLLDGEITVFEIYHVLGFGSLLHSVDVQLV